MFPSGNKLYLICLSRKGLCNTKRLGVELTNQESTVFFPPLVFPYKSIPPQTQPEKAAVCVSLVYEAKLNRNDYRTKK